MTYEEKGVFIEAGNLERFGEGVGKAAALSGTTRGSAEARKVVDALRDIHSAHRRTISRSGGQAVPEAAEWLLDNWYLAEREGLGAVRELKSAGSLRAVGKNRALITELASALVRSGRGEVTKERTEIFLTGFQKSRVLSRLELACLIPAIKSCLILELGCLVKQLGSSEPEEVPGGAVGRLFTSLRTLSSVDLSEVIESVDRTEQVLRLDPSGIYPKMDDRTRDHYRKEVSRLAKRHNVEEYRIARRVLRLAEKSEGAARHVGYYLFTKPLGEEPVRRRAGGYIAANILVTLFLTLAAGFSTGSAALALLLLLPLSELVKNAIDFIVLRTVPPSHVPRMELAGGIPPEGRTLAVISTLLTDEKSGPEFARLLEEYRLANLDAGGELLLGILADLPESEKEHIGGERDWIDSASMAVHSLNEKYGGGFYLVLRARVYSEKDKKWMGRERKRGAVTSLMGLITDGEGETECVEGDIAALRGVKYLITLDGDTRLLPGTARELTAAMLHPLNTPVMDEKRTIVISGAGIVSPRMSVELTSAGKTDFARIFAGQGGVDPYGCAAGEVYMDLCSRGGFAGKGIIDIGAYLSCVTGKIPDNLVLSHDLLEGAYLRGAYMNDVELTDSCPGNVLSYFARMDRWTRGDWQNSPWLFRGDIAEIDKFKIFDNLRASLVAPMTFVSIVTGLLLPSSPLILSAAAALLSAAARLFVTLTDTALRQEGSGKVRYHSSVLVGFGGGLLQTFTRLILLPYEAYVRVRAITASLWRMGVSKKNLLSWQTAAQSEALSGENPLRYYMKMWFCAFSAVAMFLSGSVFGIAAGAVWLVAPLTALALGRPRLREWEPPEKDREYLLERAREIWTFFKKFSTAADNYLPPDNVQEQPPLGIAHRTSPTNIGLSMLSALAALQLDLVSEEEAARHIERVLTTVERLEKWNGHILNWYDTRTLCPLHPAYVSSVDSGNLAGCLIALSEGLAELGREELAERCAALFRQMDFKPLYDPSRRLFHIGWNLAEGAPSNGWYDLLSSEARLMGYIAITKGDAPRRHWRRLSRAQVGKDGFRGMASWSGTMFEYLMPELLMPLYRDSLLFETAKFCVYVQKRRAARREPWGVSESAFYSLDSSLSYRYKAHGCSALALKRGMDREYVVSPYSSFLALAVDPIGAVKNLRRLEKYGALGEYGFYDAVDFTGSRVGEGTSEAVKTVMAHHAGMSLVAIANYLCQGGVRKCFMKNPSAAAHASLLQEKVPIGDILLRRRGNEPPEKPLRVGGGEWELSGSDISWFSPQVTLLSNGAYHLLCAENGVTRAHAGSIMPYRTASRACGEEGAPAVYLLRDGEILPLSPEPGREVEYSWAFSSRAARFLSRGADFEARYDVMAACRFPGELRKVSVNFPAGAPEGTEIIFRFEPALASERDYAGHPAFYKLGIEASQRENTLILRRLSRARNTELFLCLASDVPLGITTSREELPGRGGMEAALKKPQQFRRGWLYDPMITARARPEAKDGKILSARFALCLGSTEDDAYEGALSLLAMADSEASNLPSAAASLLKMDIDDYSFAMELASALAFPSGARTMKGGAALEGLWRFGISGELPVVCAKGSGGDSRREAALLRGHALLATCGLAADLVFLTNEGGEYYRPQEARLFDAMRRLGREGFFGVKGGVHVADISCGVESVVASADAVLDLDDPGAVFSRRPGARPLPVKNAAPVQSLPEYRWNDDASFSFRVNSSLPPRAWGNMLTNGLFGYFATDCGTGHMWYKNARECRINRWLNDPLATTGSETLEFAPDGGARETLFASPRDRGTTVTYDFGSAVWEKEVGGVKLCATAFVPSGVSARVFIIEATEGAGNILWKTDIVLSGDDRDAAQAETHYENGVLYARNVRSPYKNRPFIALASAQPAAFTCDRSAWLRGEPHGECGMGYDPVLGAVYPISGTLVLVCGTDDEKRLRALAEPEAARESLRRTRERWREMSLRLTISTPEPALDRLINGWIPYQAAACRVMGRTSVYQSGGAFGFRDQLQDLVNLIPLMPNMARQHIADCCAHQYVEGDVMHWWHQMPGGPKGVRTRCSDDLVWLPWAVCEYVEKTGDIEICGEAVPYLRSKPLEAKERERYETPERSEEIESVLGHARRALERALGLGTGRHGLALIGTGDWNDGFDNVGAEGRGESVWLSWFISHTARRFADLIDRAGDSAAAARYRKAASALGRAADNAWDGDWYLRGYYDDGTPLGSSGASECEIDSIAQSFSVLSDEASPNKREAGVKSAIRKLFDRKNGIIRLFAPPFENGGGKAGYIASYGPGFRENGGQYTHGALWLVMAALRLGFTEDAWAMLRTMIPSLRGMKTFGAEPYVVPADVYSSPGHEGRAGWSWYTGSAGWFFRIVTEELLGIKLRGGRLFVEPNLPRGWEGYSALYRAPNGAEYKIEVSGGETLINGKKCRKGDTGVKVG